MIKDIKYKVYEVRIRRRMTTEELAELSQISKSEINNIENGRNHPSIFTLASIADALNVDISELFEIIYD